MSASKNNLLGLEDIGGGDVLAERGRLREGGETSVHSLESRLLARCRNDLGKLPDG